MPKERWYYKEITHRDRAMHATRVLAARAFSKVNGIEFKQEPLCFGLNSELWSCVIRVFTTDITPFKEFLEMSDNDISEWLVSDSRRLWEERKRALCQ